MPESPSLFAALPWKLERLRWRLGLAPKSPHPAISNEPLDKAQMRRAVERSQRENWKDVTP